MEAIRQTSDYAITGYKALYRCAWTGWKPSVQGTDHCTDVCIYTAQMYLSWTNALTLGSYIYFGQIYLHWINLH